MTVKYPNKISNAARALVRDTARYLRITPKQLMALHTQVSLKDAKYAKGCFVACCLSLEYTETSALRTLLQISDKRLLIEGLVADDPRYALVFDTINLLVLKSAAQFFVALPPPSIPMPHVIEMDMLFGNITPDVPAAAPIEDPLFDLNLEEPVTDYGAPEAVEVRVGRPTLKWNDDQSKAIKAVLEWFKSKTRNPIFRLFGYAGTGKTSMAKEIAWNIEDSGSKTILFAAYTGKAASRLRTKGCSNACTIHSILYRPRIDPDTGKIVGVAVNRESPLADADLLVIDEASFINEEMALDLLSFGVPILCLGDPAQLPPIKGNGYFINARPDIMLTEIERVVADNPLIWLATRVRKQLKIKPGKYGDSIVLPRYAEVTDEMVLDHEQILVGSNTTRQALNRRYRKLHGKFDQDTVFPVKGDLLMCSKNNHENGLLNGTLWHCSTPTIELIRTLKDPNNPKAGTVKTRIEGLRLKLRSLDMFDANGKPLIVNTVCSTHHFDTNLPKPGWRDIAGTDAFMFGCPITVHKAQGSEYESVLVVDESSLFGEDAPKHQYTAITRASDRVTFKLTY